MHGLARTIVNLVTLAKPIISYQTDHGSPNVVLRRYRTQAMPMRQLSWLLALCAVAPGCSIVKETTQNVITRPMAYCFYKDNHDTDKRASELAEEAWGDIARGSDPTTFSPDYADGFQDGFAEFLDYGGPGSPPPVPPRKYWKIKYQSVTGHQAIEEWYAGYAQGTAQQGMGAAEPFCRAGERTVRRGSDCPVAAAFADGMPGRPTHAILFASDPRVRPHAIAQSEGRITRTANQKNVQDGSVSKSNQADPRPGWKRPMTASKLSRLRFRVRPCVMAWRGVVFFALVSSLASSGCASFTNPVAEGIAVRRLPPEMLGCTKEDKLTIPLTYLRQKPADTYRLEPGDVLGIWIEGILGTKEQPPPITFAEKDREPPALGYPIPVRQDGTISLPLVDPIHVHGMSLIETEHAIREAYTVTKQILQPGRDRLIVTLMRPRRYNVLVVRQDSGALTLAQGGYWSKARLTEPKKEKLNT